jgi:hypothetical protein
MTARQRKPAKYRTDYDNVADKNQHPALLASKRTRPRSLPPLGGFRPSVPVLEQTNGDRRHSLRDACVAQTRVLEGVQRLEAGRLGRLSGPRRPFAS